MPWKLLYFISLYIYLYIFYNWESTWLIFLNFIYNIKNATNKKIEIIFFLNYLVNNNNICTSCDPSCKTCTGTANNNCLTCTGTLAYSATAKTCTSTCPSG